MRKAKTILSAQVDLAAKEAIATKTVADFVTSSSRRILAAFNASMDFIHITYDLHLWFVDDIALL